MPINLVFEIDADKRSIGFSVFYANKRSMGKIWKKFKQALLFQNDFFVIWFSAATISLDAVFIGKNKNEMAKEKVNDRNDAIFGKFFHIVSKKLLFG